MLLRGVQFNLLLSFFSGMSRLRGYRICFDMSLRLPQGFYASLEMARSSLKLSSVVYDLRA